MATIDELLLKNSLSRRDFARRALGLALAAPAVSALLAACGGDDDDDDDDDSGESTSAESAQEPTATVVISADMSGAATQTAEAEAGAGEATEVPDEPTPTTAAADGEIKEGGSASFIRDSDADLYDPVLNDSNSTIWLVFSMYQSLVRSDRTATGIEPAIAESWDISDDGLVYTFHLRPGVKFADGSELSTEDVIWSLERARDSEESPWSFTLANAADITAPDDSTIEITLSAGDAAFLAAVSMFNSSIISKAYVEENGEDILKDHSMGTGPFYLKEWAVSEYTLLARNEYYWEEGLPHLDEVKVITVPDSNSAILQLQGGEVDGVIGQISIPYNRVAELQSDPDINVILATASYNYFARVNTAFPEPNPPFDDLKVRQAMAYAIDYDQLIETVQFGIAERSTTIIPNGALYHNPNIPPHEFDLDKAKELMAESEHPDGGDAEVLISAGNPQQEALAIALQAMWKEIGINLIISPLDNAVIRDRTNAGDYDVRLGGWTNDMIDPDQILGYFTLPDASDYAKTGYSNPRVEELVRAAKTELDPEKRQEMYYEVQEIYREEGPLFYLFSIPYIDALQNYVKGFWQHPLGPYGFVDTWLDK
ncbi:MAG: ABC transporter substrate-binding protein [Thermomicrobiales bacterium]